MKSLLIAALAGLLLGATLACAETRVALALHSKLGPERQLLAEKVERAISEKLMAQSRLMLIDKSEVNAARGELGLPKYHALTTKDAAALGQYIQAEVVVSAELSSNTYRIDARLLSTKTCQATSGESVSGNQEQVFDLIDVLGARFASQVAADSHTTLAVLPFANRHLKPTIFQRSEIHHGLPTSVQHSSLWPRRPNRRTRTPTRDLLSPLGHVEI